MGLLNYSTKIAPEKTSAEVQQILARAKVSSTSTFYDQDGNAIGVSFSLDTARGLRNFQLPVNVDGVQAILFQDKSIPRSFKTREQAQRTAWRIVKDWVEAQLALVSAGMASIEEIMLPYLVGDNGLTLYQNFVETQGAIEA